MILLKNAENALMQGMDFNARLRKFMLAVIIVGNSSRKEMIPHYINRVRFAQRITVICIILHVIVREANLLYFKIGKMNVQSIEN